MSCTVKAKTGTYIGIQADGLNKFTGIRYADCQRFGNPIPVGPSDQTFDATQPSPLCPQNPNNVEEFILGDEVGGLPMQEDALFLNVSAPAETSSLLPVMVWIHGGAFKSGGASSPLGDTARLTQEGQVVTVGLNYRLGFHGFVRDAQGNLGNLGLLDLVEGLRWVHENIQAFGGDPANVTIFGQSAGGAAVQYLLATDCAGSFFQRAILMSSCYGSLVGREEMDAFQLALANGIPEEASMDYVLKVQAQADAENPETDNAKYCSYAPRPGYAPLPPREDLPAAWAKAAGKVDIMVGCGLRETSLYAGSNPKLSKLLTFPLSRPVVEAILAKKSREIFSDGARDFAASYANAGGKTFFYELSWGVGESPVGGCHCCDVPLILEPDGPKDSLIYMGKSPQAIDVAAKGLRSFWSTFAREGTVRTYSIPGCIDVRKVDAGEKETAWPI